AALLAGGWYPHGDWVDEPYETTVLVKQTPADYGQWMWVRPDSEDLSTLGRLADQGRLTVDVAAMFPLSELAAAFTLSQEGHASGKIVIEV
ncbi:zinc-binding dehydrogenase, partial [Streptomyces narbonensis]|uniref:zinc-binding dehydrogenase n=1 Tax=Streptomyces narbonensis TaxID=67333 RepID=UPI0033F3D1E6